jgi:CubicO group peptidase (beta-lactamase class C family)
VEEALAALGSTRSGSIVAIRDGEDVAVTGHGTDSLGRPASASSVVPMYCLVKPLVAHAVSRAVADRELSYDDRLGDLIPVGASVRSATVLDVLEHRSGIVGPCGVDAGLLSAAERRRALSGAHETPGVRTHYSETLAFEAVGWCAEEALGTTLEQVLRADGVWFGSGGRDVRPDDLWVAGLAGPDGQAYPTLFPLSTRARTDPNPGFGGYCRPAAYLAALGSWLEDPCCPPRAGRLVSDVGLGRPVAWTRGLCASMSQELFIDRPGLLGHPASSARRASPTTRSQG